MTLSTTTNRASYSGDGTTVAFAAPFLFLQNSHIEAVLRDATGVETTWVENTQYTLTGAGNSAGGTLAAKTSPTNYTPATGETLVIRRVVPETQETDYPAGGVFPASAHEDALDKLTMLVQQHSEELARALSSPVSDTLIGDLPLKSALANKLLGFDANGDPVAAVTDSASVAAAAASAADAAAQVVLAAAQVALADAAATAAAVSEANAKKRAWPIAISDEVTAITTGTAKRTFRAFEAISLTGVRLSATAASSSGVVTVDINEGGVTILSTKLTIDQGELTSTTAATPAVISDTAIADDAEITIDIDDAGTGVTGLKLTLYGDVA